MDAIALLDVLIEPTRENVLRAVNVLNYASSPPESLSDETKKKFLHVMAGRINFCELFGPQKAAEISIAFGDSQLSEAIMRSIAKQWKPFKSDFKLQALINVCKDPNEELFIQAMHRISRLKQHSIALAFYAALGEAIWKWPGRARPMPKIQVSPKQEAGILNHHFSAFKKFPHRLRALNCLCALTDLSSETSKKLIQENANTNLSLIHEFTYGSDQQWCWLIDEIAVSGKLQKNLDAVTSKRNEVTHHTLVDNDFSGMEVVCLPEDRKLPDDLVVTDLHLARALHARPDVLRHLREVMIVSEVMMS
jgi:hypothetical protein